MTCSLVRIIYSVIQPEILVGAEIDYSTCRHAQHDDVPKPNRERLPNNKLSQLFEISQGTLHLLTL